MSKEIKLSDDPGFREAVERGREQIRKLQEALEVFGERARQQRMP